MIKTTPLQTALIAALLGSVALVGCKKKEESTDSNAPAATAPAEPAAPRR
jgi:type IV pilus biogenesis protein CpaD/CtpE